MQGIQSTSLLNFEVRKGSGVQISNALKVSPGALYFLMVNPIILNEGIKILSSSLKRRLFGTKKYNGSAEEICRSIIDCCWNKKGFFQVSAGHFNIFYIRDFGWCCDSLLKLGYEEKVKKTLDFALKHYKRSGKVTTCITKKGSCFDFPSYSVDSLPYLIKCLNMLDDDYLIVEYKDFLNSEISSFYSKVIDKSGLVKKNTHFSSMRDHVIRNSSCYDNCFVAMLKNEIKKSRILDNPFEKFDYEQLIKKNFWNGRFFYSDLNKHNFVASDANIFPFYLGIFYDVSMLKSVIACIVRSGLDKPFPLKYTHKVHEEESFILLHKIIKNYETHSCWTHLGPIYIGLVEKVDKKKADTYIETYKNIIEENKNYLEVFDFKGKPFNTFFYYSDESMLWCVNILAFIKKPEI